MARSSVLLLWGAEGSRGKVVTQMRIPIPPRSLRVIAAASVFGLLMAEDAAALPDFCAQACGHDTLQPVAWRADGQSLVVSARTVCPDGTDLWAPAVYVWEPHADRAKGCYSLDKSHSPPTKAQPCGALPLESSGQSYRVEDTGLLKEHSVHAKPMAPERVRVKRSVKAYPKQSPTQPPCRSNGYESPMKCEHLEVSVLHQGAWKTVWTGVRNAQQVCTQADGTKVDTPSDAVKVWPSPTGRHALITFREYLVTSLRIHHAIHAPWVDLEAGASTTPKQPKK